MGRIFSVIVWLVMGVFAFFAIQNHLHPQLQYNDGMSRLTHPFDTRVRYRIGSVDSRFGVSPAEVKALSHEAVQIWHDGTGEEWFVYDDEARLIINLIYDERQAESDARKTLQNDINNMVQSHNQHSKELETARDKLGEEFSTLQSELAVWQANYNDVVRRLQGINSPVDHDRLTAQHNALLAQKRTLEQKIATYERNQTHFNNSVNHFNQKTDHMNTAIETANRRFTARQFHKGIFNGKQIDIYEFSSIDDLRLTLAHELGHALGIDHNDDPTALMYPYAKQQDLTDFKLKPADVELLKNR